MNDAMAVDVLVAALTDPFDEIHMGLTAENVARKFGISRQAQDELAVESHRRANCAILTEDSRARLFPLNSRAAKAARRSIPMSRHGPMRRWRICQAQTGLRQGRHSHRRQCVQHQRWRRRRGADGGTRGPGAGTQADGKLIDYAVTAVESGVMGIGPVSAVRKLYERTGLSNDDIDVFEANEAFAAQVLAVRNELGLPPEKTNPNGSGISLGHPLGATGAIVTVKAIHELHRIGGNYALVTMCIGGGQGIAAIFQSMN